MPADDVDDRIRKASPEELLALASSGDPRLAKAARRGLHRLRSRGVPIPEAAIPRRDEVPTPRPRLDDLPSLATSSDGSGEQLVWLMRRSDGGVDVFQARIHERHGLFDFESARWSLRRVRALREDVLGMKDLPAAEVPSDWAHWLIEEGYERTVAARRTPPKGFVDARALLRVAPRRQAEHPARTEVERGADPGEAEAAQLYAAPCCRSWYPERDAIERLALLLREVDESRLVLDRVQRSDRRHGVVRRLVAEYFTDEIRGLYTRRLLDAAYVVHRSGKSVGLAPLLRAAAEGLADPLRPADGLPFARELFYRCLRPEDETEKPEAAGDLVRLAPPGLLRPPKLGGGG